MDLPNLPNLWDDTENHIDLTPTGGTKAEYPSALPSEDEIHVFSRFEPDYGVSAIEAENTSKEQAKGPETVYVVSERPNFREESLFNALSRRFRVKRLHMAELTDESLNTPISFIIDITPSLLASYSQPMIKQLQKHTVDRVIPIFLIGDAEDLINTHRNCPFPDNVKITEFKRPIDVKECVEKIKIILLDRDFDEIPKKHVMIVDDSLVFLRLIQRALEKEYNVAAASSAFNCIATLATSPELPDLIIIDYEMPDCDGITLCKMIKGERRTKDIPIIFYTGNANTSDIIESMPMINGYMLKSQPIIELRSTVDNILKPSLQNGEKIQL